MGHANRATRSFRSQQIDSDTQRDAITVFRTYLKSTVLYSSFDKYLCIKAGRVFRSVNTAFIYVIDNHITDTLFSNLIFRF